MLQICLNLAIFLVFFKCKQHKNIYIFAIGVLMIMKLCIWRVESILQAYLKFHNSSSTYSKVKVHIGYRCVSNYILQHFLYLFITFTVRVFVCVCATVAVFVYPWLSLFLRIWNERMNVSMAQNDLYSILNSDINVWLYTDAHTRTGYLGVWRVIKRSASYRPLVAHTFPSVSPSLTRTQCLSRSCMRVLCQEKLKNVRNEIK